jgi:hypothetical protein
MSTPIARTKTIYYNRALIVGAESGANTLATYLDAALSAKKLPMDRMEKTGPAADSVRVVNKCSKLGNMICGRFLDFTEGGSQAVLELDPTAEELAIRHLSPAAKEQYLEGVLTFGVRGNHVILVQSKGLRVAHLEQHLNWLLGEETRVLPPEVRVLLEDAPQREITDKLDDVDWIELRAPVPVSIFLEPPEEQPKGFMAKVMSHIRGAVPTSGTFFESLSEEAALAVENVELTMRIARASRRSKKRRTMLDEIAHNLRNVDDVDFTLKTKNGTYKAGELKLRRNISIPVESGGTMPDLKATAVVMQDWLADLITQRRVQE